jgi:hypothetical protein
MTYRSEATRSTVPAARQGDARPVLFIFRCGHERPGELGELEHSWSVWCPECHVYRFVAALLRLPRTGDPVATRPLRRNRVA